MSESISSRDHDCQQWHGDRSVGSSRSSRSGSRGGSRSGSRSGSGGSLSSEARRYVIEDANEGSAMYLPSNLIQRHRHHASIDCDEKSLQELDDTVASVSKHYSSLSSLDLDKGETSPTSVSYDVAGSSYAKDPLEEKVIRHITRAIPLELRRVESGSGRSTLSRSSRGSRASSSSRASRRNDRLERRIYQTILSSESEASVSSLSTKECSDSACRSAQFILTDLFHEAAKTMNDYAMPFGHQLDERTLSLPSSLPPRHPDGQIFDPKSVASSVDPRHVVENRASDVQEAETSPGPVDKCFADLGVTPPRVDVTNDTENESETSSFYVFDMQEQTAHVAIQQENTTSAASECTGPLDFSMDESMLQYSTTNGTSFSQQSSRITPLSPSDSSDEQSVEETEPVQQAASADPLSANWTSFDASPFEDSDFADDFGFDDAFVPFEKNVSKQSPQDTPNAEEIDLAWDISRVISGPSPNSPASVFNFFTEGDDDGDEDDVGSKTAGLWDIGQGDYHARSSIGIDAKASF